MVILRTGSTELIDKLPVHIRTTLQCYPSYVIYSDFDERYMSEDIYDVLRDVNTDDITRSR